MEIKHICSAFPKKKLTNEDLGKIFSSYNYQEFEEKIGISCRYISDVNETSISLGIEAAKKLISNYRINPNEIDYLIFCSQTHDYKLPQSSTIIQDRLQLRKECGSLDINHGCSGYIYGLEIAKSLMHTNNNYKKLLLITADTYTKFINEKDRALRNIFGDGATATLITNEDKFNGIKNFSMGTDGSGAEDLIIRNGGSKTMSETNPEIKNYGTENYYTDNDIYMNGPKIFNFTIKNIPGLVDKCLEENNLDKNDIDYFIFHQANKFMLETLRKLCKIPKEKFRLEMKNTGNTVSSTIPIVLESLLGEEKPKFKAMLVGFGVGLSFGATIIEINK